MSAMVFLKIAADVTFLFMMMGSVAVHFGAGEMASIITCTVICLAHAASFIIDCRNEKLRMIPYVIPIACVFLPGISISWAIVCGIIWAYSVFCGVFRRYIPDEEVQKKLFKITFAVLGAMLVILLIASAVSRSYSLVIFSGLISLCCSVLIMRSLRHDEAIYSRVSFQAVNISIIVAVILLSIVLGSRTVVRGVLSVFRVIYIAIATALLNVITFLINGIAYLVNWISSLIGKNVQPPQEMKPVEISTDSFTDMFGDKIEGQGLPLWIKIAGAVIAAIIVIWIIISVFRRLAGNRRGEVRNSAGSSDFLQFSEKETHIRFSSQAQGVRKQYRKYLTLIEKESVEIAEYETTEDIASRAPERFRGAAAEELRELYIRARYNGIVDKADAERAKELVRELRKGPA